MFIFIKKLHIWRAKKISVSEWIATTLSLFNDLMTVPPFSHIQICTVYLKSLHLYYFCPITLIQINHTSYLTVFSVQNAMPIFSITSSWFSLFKYFKSLIIFLSFEFSQKRSSVCFYSHFHNYSFIILMRQKL